MKEFVPLGCVFSVRVVVMHRFSESKFLLYYVYGCWSYYLGYYKHASGYTTRWIRVDLQMKTRFARLCVHSSTIRVVPSPAPRDTAYATWSFLLCFSSILCYRDRQNRKK